MLLILLVAAAAGWTWFWHYASQKAEATIAGWRAREAKVGRIYTCGSQTMGGFPFRIEVLCDRAGAVLRGTEPPLEIRAANVHVAAQIYQPNLLISEFRAPVTIGEPGKQPGFVANWKLAQSSVRGTPQAPERVSIVFDDPRLDRVSPTESLLRGKHMEVHGRIVEGSVTNKPVIEIVLRLAQATAPFAGPLATNPIDADVNFVLRGLSDFSPKPWPQRFREIQGAGGRIDIVSARLAQGDTVAVGGGALTLNNRGRLDGQLNVTVAGVESFINAVSNATRQRSGFSLSLGLGLLGGNATLEGRKAINLPLRFNDGAIFLGPIPIGQAPALF
ncbi:MAG: DUF2125 domain-containing protein [Pseudolabrys sp.]|nr:DUF2125 domain-containing protein [Pseudolabrys sp.]